MAVPPDLVALLDPPEVEFERSPLEPSGFIDSAEIQRLRAISYINAARGALAFVADCLRTDPSPGGDANLDAWVALFDASANAAGDCIADLRLLRECAGQG